MRSDDWHQPVRVNARMASDYVHGGITPIVSVAAENRRRTVVRGVAWILPSLTAAPKEADVISRASVGTVIRKLLNAVSGGPRERRTQAVKTAARPAGPTATSIHIPSCAASETIVVKTGSSVYELIVVRADCGEVLVRGGKSFTKFCPALFVGSMRNGSPVERHTVRIGLSMEFYFEDRLLVTSAVQSLSRHSTCAVTTECAATQ
jgi:hypothetical protein